MTSSQPSEWKRHVVDNPDGLDLAFDGRCLLKERHHDTGRVEVYETASGQFVMRQRRSIRPGVIAENRVKIGDDLQALIIELRPGQGRRHILRSLGLRSDTEI